VYEHQVCRSTKPAGSLRFLEDVLYPDPMGLAWEGAIVRLAVLSGGEARGQKTPYGSGLGLCELPRTRFMRRSQNSSSTHSGE
jgi:hypothetical protein